MKLQDLEVVITANTGELKAELSKVTSQLAGLQSTTSGVSQAIGGNLTKSIMVAQVATQALIGTLKAVGNALFDVFQGLVKNGTELGRIKVATNVVARNMGMTAEEVDNLRNSLEEANTFGVEAEEVIKTLAMSGLVDMADGLKILDARTGEYMTGVSGLVLAMKDLSAGALVDSAEGIDRITKFIRTGNATYVDGIIEVGNLQDAYQEFASSIGKTSGNLTAQEKSMARMNIVTQEAEKTFGAYASTMQSAGKLFQSIQQKWTQISATIGEALSPIWDTFANGFYQLTSSIFDSVQSATDGIRQFASRVAGIIIVMFRIIGRLLSKLPIVGKQFEALANFTMKPVKATKALDDAMGGFSGSTDEATESAKDLKKELAGLASFDEMNVLQQPEAGDGGAGGSAGIGAIGGGGAGADWDLGMEDWTTEANKIADDLTKVFEGLGVELKAIFGSVGETFKGIFSNAGVSEMFANLRMTFWENLPFIVEGFNNLKATWLLMWEDMKASVELYAPQILGNITGLLNSILLQAFAPTTKLISMIWADFTGSLYNVWKENGVSIMDNLGQFVTNITALFQSIWDNVLAPIIQPFLEMLENLWNDTLKGVVEEVMRFVAKLVDTALVIYNNFISPIVNALLVILKPAFDFIGNIISSVFQLVVGTIGNAIKAIIGWFNGILDFIKGVFTGNWTLAFQGLQDSASSIFWGVVDIVKGVINTIIDYYNRAVGSVNSFIQKIPNEVFQALGKNKSDVKLPTIARLAQGGIIDSPMIAMLGEAGKEAVIPLENNMGWLQELAGMINKQGGMNLTVQLGEEKIYEKFIDYVNDGTMRSNSALLNI